MGFAGAFAAAVLAGAGAGLAFAIGWRLAFPPGVQGRFWVNLSVLAQQTLTVDETQAFVALYRRLGAVLGGYLGRNLAVMALGGAGLAAALVLVLDPVQKTWDAQDGATRVWAAPASSGRDGLDLRAAAGRGLAAPGQAAGAKAAACWTPSGCFSLSLLGFEITELRTGPKGIVGPIILRTDHGDMNPAFPYLSDLETAFLVLFLMVMTAGVLWPHKGKAARPEPILKQSDFALVQVNESLKPLIRWIGDLETRRNRILLGDAPLDRPIFITGLARAGTTTVLNALTCSSELASHQYRDFPFVAAPLAWSRAQGALTRDAEPVERPHKDRILISRTSPDAFEEPLWQQFFDHLHDPTRVQRLTAETDHPAFETFFADHLRKILLLRGAGRYVSKGNYNVGRVEYLARLFPAARFVIPVRSPLEHVASLVRQHELFCRYSAEDPRVPLYLAATGHYEFGPQRRAIVYASESIPRLKAAFETGDDALAYALQWAEVYGHVARLKASLIGDQIHVVRYEDFCADPGRALAEIIAFCGLDDASGAIARFARTVSVSEASTPAAVLARQDEIAAVVREPAEQFGYRL